MSIRLRLTFWYSAILAVTLIAFGAVLYLFLSYTLYNNEKANLRQLSDEVYNRMVVTPWIVNGKVTAVVSLPTLDEFQYSGMLVQVTDQDGKIKQVSSNPFPFPGNTLGEAQKAENKNGFLQKLHTKNNLLLILSRPITVPTKGQNQFYGVLQVAAPIDSINGFLDSLLSVLVILALVVIFLGVTLGLFLARKALQPIDQVIAATSQIENGADLAKRIEYNGPPDEIGRLTLKINSMLERLQTAYTELEEAYGAQRRFVSDASHELRTPLTTIRGNVDLLEKMWGRAGGGETGGQLVEAGEIEMSREAMQDIAGEAARMSRLVNDLLSLARADAGFEMSKDYIELEPIVEQVVRRAHLLPKTVEWRVGDLSALRGAAIYGNADYLQQLLFIFIENAFKYTDEGYVQIEAKRDRDQIGVKISDTGIGMDKEEIPHIFDRFYRADPSRGKRSGTGLGLSIAKWIIDEHGGSIEVTTRKEEGTTFVVWLPVRFLPHPE